MQQDKGEQSAEQNIAGKPAPKRVCYSPIMPTKEIRTSQQEKARKTQREDNNKMTTSKPNTVSFQVNNFVKIKINKVLKSPLHPNTFLGKVIEKEHGFMKVVTKFGICTKQTANYSRHECVIRHNKNNKLPYRIQKSTRPVTHVQEVQKQGNHDFIASFFN